MHCGAPVRCLTFVCRRAAPACSLHSPAAAPHRRGMVERRRAVVCWCLVDCFLACVRASERSPEVRSQLRARQTCSSSARAAPPRAGPSGAPRLHWCRSLRRLAHVRCCLLPTRARRTFARAARQAEHSKPRRSNPGAAQRRCAFALLHQCSLKPFSPTDAAAPALAVASGPLTGCQARLFSKGVGAGCRKTRRFSRLSSGAACCGAACWLQL